MTQGNHHREHELRKLMGKQDLHSERWKNNIDKLVYIVGLTGIVLALPQVFKIYLLKNAEGLSLIFWVTYIFTAFFWTLYGIAHKSKEITVINVCWLFIDVTVVVGILMYGKGLL